ncbi:MAG: hypothetical protein II928_01435 [Paludibacteraceae bacterium]|nr:hypothetical protein [Paludibacteraceae bacterium]
MKKILFFIASVMVFGALSGCANHSTQTVPVGTIERDTILGVPCCVYLPYDYSKRAERKQEVFPVLYLQHGMYGSEDDWSNQGDLLHLMDSLLACGAVREMVVIMPDNFLGSIPPKERQALMDAPNITPAGEEFDLLNGSAHWSKLTREQERAYEMSGYWEKNFPLFMEEAEKRYSISREPKGRAIAGLSMGGFHTMHVSHYLHGQFSCIGLFSAVILSPTSAEVYDNWQAEVREMMASEPVYWIGMGREDHLYDQLQEYRLWLEDNNIEYTYYESTGGHTWENWQDYLCRFLKKF